MGWDPLWFRLRNALGEGNTSPAGERYRHVHARETLERAADAAGWGTPKAPFVGRGIALSAHHTSPGQYNAEVQVDAEGAVRVLTALADTGAGAHTVLRQIVAETLELPAEAVRVEYARVDECPPDAGVGGSRVTALAGQAALEAACTVREHLVTAAAHHWGARPEDVRLERGRIVGPAGRAIRFAGVARQAATAAGGRVAVRVAHVAEHSDDVPTFHVQVAEVAVDPDTGQVQLRRLVTAHDVGTILHPVLHQGQIEGAVVQGLGYALTEELVIEDGRVVNAHLGDYKLPTAQDVPELLTVLVRSSDSAGPYQTKPIGEGPNCPVAPAIANAVFDACGVRITQLPITAEKVWESLRAQRRVGD
jgi:CO/xanthine dehydrogenase Mo-binding subunit